MKDLRLQFLAESVIVDNLLLPTMERKGLMVICLSLLLLYPSVVSSLRRSDGFLMSNISIAVLVLLEEIDVDMKEVAALDASS